MPFIQTHIPDLLVFEPKIFEDSRGYFFESFNLQTFRAEGIGINFVQDNQSSSNYGVIRGLHYQLDPFAQVKLIRVLSGRILDVAVDIRKGSPTFGKSFSIELSAENKKQLFVPAGFAHGFSVLSEQAEVFYKCDSFYNKESEAGILYNDPSLNIDWKIPAEKRSFQKKIKGYLYLLGAGIILFIRNEKKVKILVTGGNGQLGKELREFSSLHTELEFVFLSREDLPIHQFELVRNYFNTVKPAYCINCAAYTAVDKAESEKDLAFLVNGEAVGVLAAVCKEHDTRFIHISTDYVFNGEAAYPYTESFPTDPINEYGASKLEGETQAIQLNPDSIIIRTSWLYSSVGKNFVKTMIQLMNEKDQIKVVKDQLVLRLMLQTWQKQFLILLDFAICRSMIGTRGSIISVMKELFPGMTLQRQ
jgi:dTDP-4-dehydrorhamnose 3,5-epimerase